MVEANGVALGPDWLVHDLQRVEKLLLSTASASDHPLVAEASSHLMKAGGKRLRPALVLLSAHSGTPGRKETDLAAAAVELIHLASLYHDDVMDETETRRGVPTVHAKWGVDVAILSGDYLFARGCLLGAEAGGDVPELLSRGLADVCEGQIAEDEAVGDEERTVPQYLDTIGLKTAALFRTACEMGASTAGASAGACGALAAYGTSLGMVFQVMDDLLDLVGAEEEIGKQPGTDLREGVFTLPVLMGCDRDPGLRRDLARNDWVFEEVLDRLHSNGALSAAYGLAEREAAQARQALASLGAEGDWVEALEGVVSAVLAQVERPTIC